MKRIACFIICLLLASPAFAADAPANQITIDQYMYMPATLTVATGTKVTWVNKDEIPHTIVDSAEPKAFRSAALDTDETYSYTFTKPGTYQYFCTLHPKMVGTIIVADAK